MRITFIAPTIFDENFDPEEEVCWVTITTDDTGRWIKKVKRHRETNKIISIIPLGYER